MADWVRELAVGDWYQGDGEPFEIVGLDPANEVVLIQYFDGALEEIDFDNWMELAARPVAAPEDWSGALDVEKEDYGVDPDVTHPQRWDSPLDHLDERL